MKVIFVTGLLQTEYKIVDKEIVFIENTLDLLFHNQKKRISSKPLTDILDWSLRSGYFIISKLISCAYNMLGRNNLGHIISILQLLPDENQWKSAIDSIVLLHETYKNLFS